MNKLNKVINKKSKYIKVLITGGLFLLLVVGGLFYKYTQLKNQIASDAATLETQAAAQSKDKTQDWTTYVNDEYGFYFKHPRLNDECCFISGPVTGEITLNISFTDLNSVNFESQQDPFAGIGVYVVETDLPFYQYLEEEKEALIQQGQDSEGEDYQNNSSDNEVSLAGQQGLELIGYSWDEINRYYFPLPDSTNVLVLSKGRSESFSFAFTDILASFTFID
jgi:hypothetical protein